MRIAMIGSRGVGSNYGGVERVLDELCPRLAALGHEIDVYSDRNVTFDDRDGVRAIRIPALGGKHFETISRSALSLSRAMGAYDLVHFHAVGPGILSAATKLFGQRSLVTIHGLDRKRDKWGKAARLCLGLAERTLVANADQISVVSESLRRYFVERYDAAATYIPNGVPLKEQTPPGALLAEFGLEPRRYVFFASRLTPEKGCQDLIAAFNQLNTDMKLVIAGSSGAPAYLDSLRAVANPKKTLFVGHRTGHELAELFSNAYVFVLPSYIEGMSMALLEALAYRIPALVSDIPENRAVVGEYGFYFPAKDVASLEATLGRLTSDEDSVAEAARRLHMLDRPDWDSVARRYDRLYHAMIRASPARYRRGRAGAMMAAALVANFSAKASDLTRRFGPGAGLVLIGRVLQNLNGFLLSVLIVRRFGLAAAGTLTIATIATVVIALLGTFGRTPSNMMNGRLKGTIARAAVNPRAFLTRVDASMRAKT